MKKMAAVTGLLLLSSSLFVGCGTTAAPNPGAGNYQGTRTEATGGPQPLKGYLQYNRHLQTVIQTIPGSQHATVYVSGDTAFVVFNEMGTTSAGRVASMGKNRNVPLQGDYGVGTVHTEPGMATNQTGPTGTGNQLIRPSTYGTSGVGLDSERPGANGIHHQSDYGMLTKDTRLTGLNGTGKPSTFGLSGQRGPIGITGEAGTAYGITSLNLQKKIADTIQAADKSIQHVYLVTRVR